MSDLWMEASADAEAEHTALRQTRAKVACASLWPFLTLAKTAGEFEHRLALVADRIVERVDTDLIDPVVASLRADFAVLAAKDAEGREHEDSDDDSDDGKPDWLKEKIKGKESVRVEAFYDDAQQAWIRVAVENDANQGMGNPWYFTGGPEGGPNTGQTNQFPTFPDGNPGDPWNPMNSQYPAQPQPWTVPPGGDWKEFPMNFNPPGGGNHYASTGGAPVSYSDEYNEHGDYTGKGRARQDAEMAGWVLDPEHPDGIRYDPDHKHSSRHVAADTDVCRDCNHPVRRVSSEGQRWWSHTGDYGAMADDDHMPYPDQHSKNAAHRLAQEGVQGGPGPNPNYFAGGAEGVAGDQGQGFPPDISLPEDADDWMVNQYGAVPSQHSTGTNPARTARRHATQESPAPHSDSNLGTDFASEQERTRYEKAQRGEAPGSRDSASFASRKHAFFDPGDPGVRMVTAAGDPFSGGGNPFAETVGGAPEAPPAMTPGGPGAEAMPPMGDGLGGSNVPQDPATTKPRQMPGGGGDMGAMASLRALADGMSMNRPTTTNPYGTDDPFDAKTWENASKQRPMVGMDHMNFNGPQNPGARDQIRTTNSPGLQEEDEEERR